MTLSRTVCVSFDSGSIYTYSMTYDYYLVQIQLTHIMKHLLAYRESVTVDTTTYKCTLRPQFRYNN